MSGVDLNADLGEGCGDDLAMLDIVSSANIACGGHAGDAYTMRETAIAALKRDVVIGAHPGFEDRENFGRKRILMSPDKISALVTRQTLALQSTATTAGGRVSYVKPHGALANWAAEDVVIADAVLSGIKDAGDFAVLAMAGSVLERAALRTTLPVYSEIFADRTYLSDGRLAPREGDGAVIHDTKTIVERLMGYLETGLMPTLGGAYIPLTAHSICIHGDTPGALVIANAVKSELQVHGYTPTPFLTQTFNV